MRTTVDIPDDVLERAKRIAAEKGRKLSEVVADALREAFYRREQQSGDAGVGKGEDPMPSDSGDGLMPGVDLNDNAELRDLMDDVAHHNPASGAPADLDKLR